MDSIGSEASTPKLRASDVLKYVQVTGITAQVTQESEIVHNLAGPNLYK